MPFKPTIPSLLPPPPPPAATSRFGELPVVTDARLDAHVPLEIA
jgi:hypothetical protein